MFDVIVSRRSRRNEDFTLLLLLMLLLWLLIYLCHNVKFRITKFITAHILIALTTIPMAHIKQIFALAEHGSNMFMHKFDLKSGKKHTKLDDAPENLERLCGNRNLFLKYYVVACKSWELLILRECSIQSSYWIHARGSESDRVTERPKNVYRSKYMNKYINKLRK